jgi:hypothetical protein
MYQLNLCVRIHPSATHIWAPKAQTEDQISDSVLAGYACRTSRVRGELSNGGRGTAGETKGPITRRITCYKYRLLHDMGVTGTDPGL